MPKYGAHAMQIATRRVSGVRRYVKGEAGEIYPLIELHGFAYGAV